MNEQEEYSSLEFWCSHTFLSVPLSLVLKHVKQFVDRFPSEVVTIEIHPDKQPINGESVILKTMNQNNVVKLYKRDDEQIIRAINDIIGDKVLTTFTPDMTLQHITRTLKKNVIIFFDGELYPQKTITYHSSWIHTKDFSYYENANKCKDWVQDQEKDQKKWTVMALQVTPDKTDILQEIILNKDGLNSHAF